MSGLITFLEKPKVNERQFKSNFGVSSIEFTRLLEAFSLVWDQRKTEAYKKRWQGRERQKKKGGGVKPKLSTAKICLALVLYQLKRYPSFDTLGTHFNITGSYACKQFYYHLESLQTALDQMGVLPKTSFENASQFQNFLKANEVTELLIDATERVIQRPQDKDIQEKCYSGKKKDIPLKTQSFPLHNE